MARVKTIDVYANPYVAVDESGVPQGVVQMPGTRNYIGAQLDVVASRQTGKSRFYFVAPNEAKGGEGVNGFAKVTVPFSAPIVNALLDGSLIAADEKGAWAAGIAKRDFSPPEERFEAEKKKAEELLKARYGDDAPELQDVPREATEEKADDARDESPLIDGGRETLTFKKG